MSSGKVPWPEMSMVGTPFDLRGYRWGHYRDRNMIFGLLEYRHMFTRKTLNKRGNYKSRHGFAVWSGFGSIAPTPFDYHNWLPNAGIGYRFEVQPRMNARVDFGIGRNSTGVYVSFNEVF